MSDTRVERRLGWVTVNGQRYPREKASDWLDAIKKGLCPFCGSGPFTVVAIHVAQVHGVGHLDLREMLGITNDETICDPTYSAACSSVQRTAPSARGSGLSSRPERRLRQEEALEAGRLARLAAVQEKWDRRMKMLRSMSVEECAVIEGVQPGVLRSQLRRRGAVLEDRTVRRTYLVDSPGGSQ